MQNNSRTKLIAYAIKNKGDWENIYNDITSNNEVSDEEIAKAETVDCITFLDEEYPKSLKQNYKPPFVLFCKGDKTLLNESNILAVVGSRQPKETTLTFTQRFVEKQSDKIIISGLSKGIDTKALKTALKNGNKVIAVLGSGIDYCYPAENQALYTEIALKGLIVSEYPFDTKPQQLNFPMRNRIISGLSKMVCVMDLTKHSGTLVLVNMALESGKEVFVKPELEEENNEANRLLNEGANCLTLDTILE